MRKLHLVDILFFFMSTFLLLVINYLVDTWKRVPLSACHNSLMNTFTLCGGTLVRRASEEIAWFPFRGEVRMLCVIQLPPSMETGTILLRVPRAHRVYRAHGAPVPTDHDPRAHGVIWFCLFFGIHLCAFFWWWRLLFSCLSQWANHFISSSWVCHKSWMFFEIY